jgi:hypothetical protein
MTDLAIWLAVTAGFLFVLVILGIVADSWERRDAKRRNHARRVR